VSRKLASPERLEGFLAVDSGIWHQLGAAASRPGAWSNEGSSG